MTTPTRGPEFVSPIPRRRSTSRDSKPSPDPTVDDLLSGDGPGDAGADGADEPRPVLPPLPTRQPRPARSRRPGTWMIATMLLVLATLVLYAYGSANAPIGNELPIAGVILLPVLMLLAALLTRRAGRAETRFDLRGIMLFGMAMRGAGAYIRFLTPVDAIVYHQEGSRIAPDLRSLDFWVDTGRPVPGTGWIRLMSGFTHAVVDDMFTAFLIFTFLSFLGTYLCYQAFRTAVPNGDHQRYALLLFLWPSLIYWPSSIGKEAWMILGIGVSAWGISRVVTGRASIGLPILVLGLAMISAVRPHIALMILLGFAVSLLARPGRQTSFRVFGRLFSVVLLLIAGSLIAGKTAELLKVDSDGTEAISAGLDLAQAKTEQGGASFSPAVVRNPVDYPYAFVTVWFRPFPWEAKGGGGDNALTQLVSSAENILLLLLIALSWRRIVALPRALIRIPYVTFAVTYCVAFVYAFAVIGNFGILARQRTQGIVLFFVILCVPVLERTERADAGWRVAAARLRRSRPAAPDPDDQSLPGDRTSDEGTGAAVAPPNTPPRRVRPASNTAP